VLANPPTPMIPMRTFPDAEGTFDPNLWVCDERK